MWHRTSVPLTQDKRTFYSSLWWQSLFKTGLVIRIITASIGEITSRICNYKHSLWTLLVHSSSIWHHLSTSCFPIHNGDSAKGATNGCCTSRQYIDGWPVRLRTFDQSSTSIGMAGMKLKKEKCAFCLPQVEYLGHVISEEGLHPSAGKVKAIKEAPKPSSLSELKSFLGFDNYYSKFLPNAATVLAPLNKLLSHGTMSSK